MAAPNMHSLATAAVSNWAARPRPRTVPQPCISASFRNSLCRARSPAPSALDPRGPGPLLAAPRPRWRQLPPDSAAGSPGLSRGVSRSFPAPGPGPASRAPLSRPRRASRSLILCSDRQFPGGSCVRGGGGDEGNSVSNLDRTRGSGNSRPRHIAAGRKWLLAPTTRFTMANLRPGEVNS